MSQLTLTATGEAVTVSTTDGLELFVAAGSGEANTVVNVGGGDAEIFRDKVGAVLNFRTLSGTGSITVAQNGDVVEISGGAGGEVNTGANVGGGAGTVFRDKTGVTLNFRTLVATGGITVTVNGDVIEIGGGGATGTADFIPVFDASGNIADGPLFVDDAATPTLLSVPIPTEFRNVNRFLLLTGVSDGPIYTSSTADGALAEAHVFDTANTFSTGGASILRVKNAGAGRFDVTFNSILTLSPAGMSSTRVVLDASLATIGRFDLGFNGSKKLRLNSNGVMEVFNAAGSVALITIGTAAAAGNNVALKSPVGGVKAFGFETNTAGTTSAGVGYRFGSVPNTSLWDDVDAAFISVEPAITGIGSGRQVWKINGFGDTFWIADDAANNAVVDSPDLILRANHDADAGGGVTPTAFDALIRHNMLTAGASPTSQLDFLVNGAVRLSLPSVAPPTYTLNATVVLDRTLLASASATTINNNNVLAALITDLKARNLIV